MIRRLIENSAIIVRIDASRWRMPKRTLRKAVTRPGAGAGDHRGEGRDPGIDAADDGNGGNRRAERERAVDGEVREVEDAEGEVDPEADEGEDEAELDRPEECDGAHAVAPLPPRP